MLPECKELKLNQAGGVLTIMLNRPHKRNAMNARLVTEIMSVFETIEGDRGVRAVVLRGAGGNFCAGADLSSLNLASADSAGSLNPEQSARQFNRSFGHLITRVNHAPQIVITLLEGAVLGGGFGLACISDVAIADAHASFAMPETSLGIIPAQIAPFVVQRVGLTQARRLALIGEGFDGKTAHAMGMVHFVTQSTDEMQVRLDAVLDRVKRCAPGAIAATKKLILQVGSMEHEVLLDSAAELFAIAINGPEGKEGTRAFLEKRRPDWAV